jgi:glucan phosphoethanolaminetransferase (alkaline phosphatase superfamily)
MESRGRQINQVAFTVLMVLSVTALLAVLSGYRQAPLPDEGFSAHIFQLAIGALVPVVLVFFATADWTEPGRSTRRLIIPAAVVLLAFSALYYLEHYFYPLHYH